jgi:hypothetical protein
MNSKNKNIRDLYGGINAFKSGYQCRNNIVNDENVDLLADTTLLNRQIELCTPEPLVPGPSLLEVEIAIAKLKSISLQIVIRFWQNLLKQEMKRYCL